MQASLTSSLLPISVMLMSGSASLRDWPSSQLTSMTQTFRIMLKALCRYFRMTSLQMERRIREVKAAIPAPQRGHLKLETLGHYGLLSHLIRDQEAMGYEVELSETRTSLVAAGLPLQENLKAVVVFMH